MLKFVAARLLRVIPLVLVVSVIAFTLIRLIPGDALIRQTQQGNLAGRLSPEDLANLRESLGISGSLPEQFGRWVSGLATFDFGTSIQTRRPVLDEIRARAPVTFQLAIMAVTLSAVMGLTSGIISALKQDTLLDYLSRSITFGALAMPNFFLAVLVLLLPAIWWGWAPPLQYADIWEDPAANLQKLWLPALVLSAGMFASVARMTRSAMLEVIRQDYIRTAKAKGLPGRIVLFRHSLRNAMLPVFTILGLQMAYLISGTVIVESVFGLPGIGKLMLDAVVWRDYPLLQGLVLFTGLLLVLVNLAVDISYAFFDPRIREAYQAQG